MAKTVAQLPVTRGLRYASHPVAAAVKIPCGTHYFLDANGRATPTKAAGLRYGGLARGSNGIEGADADNTDGDAGDITVEADLDLQVLINGSGFTQADVGKQCYLSDNDTGTTDPTNNVACGEIKELVSSSKVFVDITQKAATAQDGAFVTVAFNGATGEPEIRLVDNLAEALSICQGANNYLRFKTTNSAEAILVDQSLTIADGKNVVLDTTTGTKIGTDVGQKLGFWNATPIVQPAAAAQGAITDSTSGSTANATLAAVGATNSGDVSATINANFAKTAVLVNALRTALVNAGLIKGAA